MISGKIAEHYTWGAGCDAWHLVKSETLSVIEEAMPPGTSEVRHFHTRSRQFFFVLTGHLTIEVEGQLEELRAHEGLEIAPGGRHRVFNKSDQEVRFLVTSTPPSHGDRIPAE